MLAGLQLGMLFIPIAVVLFIVVLLVVIRQVTRLRHRVPPQKVMVIYGRWDRNEQLGSGIRLVTGGGT